jgi:general secretion pathway protein M
MEDFLEKLRQKLTKPIDVGRERLAAIALLVFIGLAVFLTIPYPLIRTSYSAYERARALQFRLDRLKLTVAERKPLTEMRDSLKTKNRSDESFFATAPVALASAELQNQIKRTITEAEGELSSTQVIPEHTDEQFTQIGVKVHMSGDTQVLRRVIYTFETAKPYLFIENINIRPIRSPKAQNGQTQTATDKLAVDFDVVGFMRVR